MIIAISLSRIIEHVYAHSALAVAQNPELERPPLLGEKQDAPLRVLAYHALCRILTELCPVVTLDGEVTEPSEADIICLNADVIGAETLGATLRLYIEDALCVLTLQGAWPERATAYSSIGESILKAIKTLKATTPYRIRRG